jgi:hypothetical protein
MPAPTKLLLALTLAAATLAAGPTTAEEIADRYTMSPVEGGFLRLDKETGAVAMCARKNEAWVCDAVEDRSGAATDSKLETENKDLKARIKALEDALDNVATPTTPPDTGPPAPKTQLPTEEEVDQALDYVERIFKKFRDRLKKLDEPLPPDPGSSDKQEPARPL